MNALIPEPYIVAHIARSDTGTLDPDTGNPAQVDLPPVIRKVQAISQVGRVREQFLAGRGSAQEREVRSNLELGVPTAHPKIPCKNHLWDPVPASSPSPARKIQNRSPASSSTWK